MRLEKMATFCYLVGDETSRRCALIDPAFETDEILAEVEQSGYRVTHLINTHSHSDHTAGNAAILAATDAKLLIHKLDAPGLSAATNMAFSRAMGGKGSPEPDVLLDDGDTIEIGESSLEVIHTPGHSLGGICLYTEGHIFTGDTLFAGGYGRSDLESGEEDVLVASVRDKIFTRDETTIIYAGHGPTTTIGQEKKQNWINTRLAEVSETPAPDGV